MKKLLIFLLLVPCVVFFKPFVDEDIFSLAKINKVCFVVDGSEEVEGLKSGNDIYIYCSSDDAKNLMEKLLNVKAVQLYLDGSSMNELLRSLKTEVLRKETLGTIEIIYGYSPKFNTGYYLSGRKVNVMLACYEEQIVAGIPIILTGF